MDRPRHQLLADAGGSAYEHVRVALGDEGDVLSQPPDGLALADHAIHVGIAVWPHPLDSEVSQRRPLVVSEHRDQDELIGELDDIAGPELAAVDYAASPPQQALSAILELELEVAAAPDGELLAREKAGLHGPTRFEKIRAASQERQPARPVGAAAPK